MVFKILEVYLCDHAHQLEYSKQYSMIEVITGLFLLQLIIHLHSQSKPPQSCCQKSSTYSQVYMGFYLYYISYQKK